MQNAYYAGDWPISAQVILSGPGFGWHSEAGIHILRLIMSGALDRHPGLKLLSGHWGELAAFYLDRLDETLPLAPIGLDRLPSEYYRSQVWLTPSGMYSRHQLDYFLAEVGPERIIWSEDYPYIVRDDVRSFLESAGLPDATAQALAHGNAEALLGV